MKIFKGEFKKTETWPMLRLRYDLATTYERRRNDLGTIRLGYTKRVLVCAVENLLNFCNNSNGRGVSMTFIAILRNK